MRVIGARSALGEPLLLPAAAASCWMLGRPAGHAMGGQCSGEHACHVRAGRPAIEKLPQTAPATGAAAAACAAMLPAAARSTKLSDFFAEQPPQKYEFVSCLPRYSRAAAYY